MNIKRKRYVVMRNNRTEIWCGISRQFSFKKLDEINNASIKTYDSESRAKSSCSSWDRNFEVVEITETIDWSE